MRVRRATHCKCYHRTPAPAPTAHSHVAQLSWGAFHRFLKKILLTKFALYNAHFLPQFLREDKGRALYMGIMHTYHGHHTKTYVNTIHSKTQY